jgi:hypothetical protein
MSTQPQKKEEQSVTSLHKLNHRDLHTGQNNLYSDQTKQEGLSLYIPEKGQITIISHRNLNHRNNSRKRTDHYSIKEHNDIRPLEVTN